MTKKLQHAKAVSHLAWVLSNSRGLTGSPDYSHHATSPCVEDGALPTQDLTLGTHSCASLQITPELEGFYPGPK